VSFSSGNFTKQLEQNKGSQHSSLPASKPPSFPAPEKKESRADLTLFTGCENYQLILAYDNGNVNPKITMNCGVKRNGKSYG